MEQRFLKSLVIFFFINFQNVIIKKILVDTGTMDLKTLVTPKPVKTDQDIQKVLNDNHLNITIKCNSKIVNFLNVTFNFNFTYQPFCKSNNKITYIHKESNHQPSILRQIPRLSERSSNEKIFKESKQI